jgi:3-oxoadipyl-CoA thiolase
VSEVNVYSAVRTPVGRAGGALADVRPDDLAALAVKAAVERAGIDPAALDDVILGCANGAGEDNRNVARMAALLAGLPVEIPGQTINRLCGSGLQAVISAFHAVRAGEGDCFVAGGVESMTRAPYVQLKKASAWDRKPPEMADTTVGWRFVNAKMPAAWTIGLGETAEKVAKQYGITRDEQDAFAYQSQQRAARAIADGVFRDEIVPVPIAQRGSGAAGQTVDADEHPRPDVTVSDLAKLKPAFAKDGTVTAGSSSGINDGAAALVVGSPHVLTSSRPPVPLARIVASAVAGVDPSVMGLGPVPATCKALERAGLKVSDLDLVELNEAFAAQALACMRDLELDPAKTNIYGGGIALGHPLGATGAKLLTTLVHALRRTGGQYGLVTMCIGVGQGIALIVERA